MRDSVKGILAVILASTIWGLSPVYYKVLGHIPPLEVLSHRTLWSLVFFGLILIAQGRLGQIRIAFGSRRQVANVVLAALMVTTNWFLFIYAVQVGRAVEASLGYYILPLVSVVMGVIFFGEGWSRNKVFAVTLAGLAVLILTLGLGAAPYMSLTLAITFGIYSVIKKRTVAGPVVSVTAEVLLLAPLALVWLWGVHTQGFTGVTGRNLGTFGNSLSDSLMLMLSGPLTAGPLILFSYASRRISLASAGLVGYLNPTLQFLIAALVFAEPITRWHAIAFPLIWKALAIYSFNAVRSERAIRKSAIKASTSSATVMKGFSEASAKP